MITDLALDRPDLTHGWWGAERHGQAVVRWTDGDARLPVGDGGARILEITAGCLDAYVVAAGVDAAEEERGMTTRAIPAAA